MNDSIRAEAQGIDSRHPFEDRPSRWFLRGTAIGMLMMAAVNALSYFVRSADWGSLVGPARNFSESLGFPLVMWEGGNSYGGMFVDYINLGWNILFAALIGSVLGLLAAKRTDFLNSLFQQMQAEGSTRDHQPIQFSLRGMLIVTGMVAVASMLAKNYAAKPHTLVAIYALGPLFLVLIAMLPQKLQPNRMRCCCFSVKSQFSPEKPTHVPTSVCPVTRQNLYAVCAGQENPWLQ